MTVAEQLKGKDFLCLSDYTKEEIQYLLDLAAKLKDEQKKGIPHPHLAGKTLGMIFEKSSTRTRVSFEVGMYQLGGMAMFLSGRDLQIGRGEPISDTAQVLSRYIDGIMIRTFSDDMVRELAEFASIPIINGLTDMQHPCQVMADFQTIIEQKGKLEGLKLAYVGDGNNMVHSLMIGAAKVGMHVSVASPAGYEPNASVTEMTKQFAQETGVNVVVTHDPMEAVKDADVIYTDVWASMGQEAEQQERIEKFKGFEVNGEMMKQANPDAIFLHCLPAHRGEEVAAEVIDGPQSRVFDQAENRLHAQKAVLVALMG
ncbi:ornithine carbamoyltransferase [Aneurinibacillus soli]|uniref:Ornithine carbamoyltransferase n=1 Tax=Aneurinibacillus soli TaxID=1500254 RepID=A0A0U5B6J2_9BACL|nr:ornithine carbamoyltransferase [Aneurinibacillus soli]PYE61457.1 ornithine carbamoyltransferase [Aneurinibacillus soli]BAU26588.1 Ornithine carbamoyltransferase [Aneurinibacillus soli]